MNFYEYTRAIQIQIRRKDKAQVISLWCNITRLEKFKNLQNI